jgi:MFS family permease
MRPIGGILADRIGGARVLSIVFLGAVPFALLLVWTSMLPFTVGALGCAALLGAGNGAVFKLVPQYFPSETGSVTGLVGALGGLGGFFPPLLLGFLRDQIGVVWPGFVLLAMASLLLWFVNGRVFLRRDKASGQRSRAFEQLNAGAWATLWSIVLIAAIVVGSRNLQYFDPALVIYTFAVIFATWGVIYHYNVWLQKPPDADVLGSRLGNRAPLGSLAQRRLDFSNCGGESGRATLHSSALALRWWMHQFPFLGMHAGDGHHLPAGLRLDFLPQPTGRSDDLRSSTLRILGG